MTRKITKISSICKQKIFSTKIHGRKVSSVCGEQGGVEVEVGGVGEGVREVVEHVAAALIGLIEGVGCGDGVYSAHESVDIAFFHNDAACGVDCLGSSACAIGHNGSAASLGLEVDCRQIIFERRVHEDCGLRIEARKFVDTLSTGAAFDTGRKFTNLRFGQTDEYDAVAVGHDARQADKFAETFTLVPAVGDAEDDAWGCGLVGFWREGLRIDAVMDGGDTTAAQIGLPGDRGEPSRHGHESEAVGDGAEVFLLEAIVQATVVGDKRCRIGVLFGTVVAAGLPAVAAGIIEICAMAGKWPAIVERPHHGGAPLPEEAEEEGVVEVVAVDIVKVDYVGPIILDKGYQAFRCRHRTEAVEVEEAREPDMSIDPGFAADTIELLSRSVGMTAICERRLPAALSRTLGYALGYAAMRAPVGCYIYLKQFHKDKNSSFFEYIQILKPGASRCVGLYVI